MIENLVANFCSLNAQLEIALKENNTAGVRRYDAEVSSCYDEILSYSPIDIQEAKTLAEFVVEKISAYDVNSPVWVNSKKKLVSLIVDAHRQKFIKETSKSNTPQQTDRPVRSLMSKI